LTANVFFLPVSYDYYVICAVRSCRKTKLQAGCRLVLKLISCTLNAEFIIHSRVFVF